MKYIFIIPGIFRYWSNDLHLHSKRQELLDCGIGLWKKRLAESLDMLCKHLVVKPKKPEPVKRVALRSAYLNMCEGYFHDQICIVKPTIRTLACHPQPKKSTNLVLLARGGYAPSHLRIFPSA